jgi:serine/threonine protein kinase/WD40 repeat protein
MTQSDSIFGAELDRLKRLLTVGEEESDEDSTEHTPKIASLHLLMERPGGQIGRYKLLSVLGEGGMGVVYLAQQEQPIKRRVALKVIKPGMDSKRVLARFETERQALALLDHPNIAHVYDAGTTEAGRPYFVMKYVKGLPITEHCDHYKLTIEERLHLFVQICQAVHYAHQKGIIHRDIKPSNIVVPRHDEQAVPKIIDFGVAKAMAQPLTQRKLMTEDGQLLGTPEYMSPEQADVSVEDIDIRSDIYSLGVLLYVLLTGVLPFDSSTLRTGGIEHIRQIIRETDPTTPSTRLSRLKPEDCTQVAQNRQVDGGVLGRKLRGDLDWVVMKCLEKDRTRRYESANDLAMDLKRYLANEPVVARPPTVGYRLQKAWRRNRLLYSAATAVAVALMVGLVVAAAGWWQAILARANEAALRQQAEQQELVARRRAYAADMNLAQQALATNNLGRVVMLLERQKPKSDEKDLRGWEWRYLWSQTRPDEHEVFFDGPNRLSGLEFSSDGRFLMWFTYASGVVKRMTVMNLQTRQTVISRTDCRRAAFAQRTPRIVFAQQQEDERDDIVFWDLNTRREARRLPLGADVSWLGFTPDDRLLVSLSYRPSNAPAQSPWELTVWEVSTGEIQWRQVIKSPITSYRRRAAISPDGQMIAISVSGFGFRVLRISDGGERFSRQTTHDHVHALTFSPDGAFLLSASGVESATIQLWDVATGECVRTLGGHSSYVSDLQFTPDGKYLVSSSSDQTIRLWDWPEGRPVAILRGHLDEVDGLSVSPEGRILASRGRDGSIFLWPLAPPPQTPAYRTLPVKVAVIRPLRSAVFTPDSHSIIAAEPKGGLAQWDVTTLRQMRRWRAPEQNAGKIGAIAPDGSQAAILDSDGRLSLLDLTTGVEQTNVLQNAPRVTNCWFSASGRYLLTLTTNESRGKYNAKVWDLLSGADIGEVQGRSTGLSFCYTLQALDAWVLGQSGSAQIRGFQQPQEPPRELLPVTSGVPLWDFDVSPDGRIGAGIYEGGYLRVWDLQTAEPLQMMRVFRRAPHSVTFSPDGRRLAAGGSDREAVKLWETTTWQEVLTLTGEVTGFFFVAFSPDGQTLIAYNRDGLLHIWSAPSLEAIDEADAPLSQTR